MAYNRANDFLGLLRNTNTPQGVRSVSMPGIDYVVATMAAMGMFTLWVDPVNAPSSNQATTVWLKTSTTPWAIEGTIWLWNGATYVPATPQLWGALWLALGA